MGHTGIITELNRILLIAALLFFLIPDDSIIAQDDEAPAWPLRDCYTIASTFGEYRPGHVHMGIDIRSRDHKGIAVMGLPVYAVEDGYISRIKIKAGGYGRALYLTLRDGRTAVYAHLDSFIPQLEDYIRELQWKRESFALDITLPAEKFIFGRGETIGFSGRSGTKYPHLHFEIRNAAGRALNPMAEGFTIEDSRAPVFSGFALVPRDEEAEVNSDCRPISVPAERQNNYLYSIRNRIDVFGVIGLAVDCFDKADDAPNSHSVYRLELTLDGRTFFKIQFDSCDYYSYQQIEIDREPYLNRIGAGIFHRLFKIDGNKMPFYEGEGIINTRDFPAGEHEYVITAEDYNGNRSELRGKLNFISTPTIPRPLILKNFSAADYSAQEAAEISYNVEFFKNYIRIEAAEDSDLIWTNGSAYKAVFRNNIKSCFASIPITEETWGFNYLADGSGRVLDLYYIESISPENGGAIVSPDRKFKVVFPPGGVYEPMFAAVKEVEAGEFGMPVELASLKAYRCEPQWIPLRKSAKIVWNYEAVNPQTGIYFLNGDGNPVFLGNAGDSLTVTADCLNLETFVLVTDSVPPVIRITHPRKPQRTKDRRPIFHFSIADSLSGIDGKSIRAEIDGEWILAEYDPPRKAVYTSVRNPLPAGEHTIKLMVSDKSSNETVFEHKFTIYN